MAFSRLAKLISQARVISLPLPVARPRMRAMEATGRRVRRREEVPAKAISLWDPPALRSDPQASSLARKSE
jgi:hypothetical protein